MSSFSETFSAATPPIHPAGRPFIAIFAVATVGLFWLAEPLGYLGLLLTLWCTLFFRDPERVSPDSRHLVVSPADGVVQLIAEVDPPKELNLGEDKRLRISVFMNVFNCHVNRSPVSGVLVKHHYWPGKFFNAALDKASELNERNGMTIEMASGQRIGCVQIAGLVARRILWWKDEGETLSQSERFGMIRFGSRVDVYVPKTAELKVKVGQTMVAGESVLAALDS